MAFEKILVLGAKGMLGSELVPLLRKSGEYEVLTHSRTSDADYGGNMSSPVDSHELLRALRPDYIINLAALTNVDMCEIERDRAYELNVKPVENIVTAIAQYGLSSKLIQISTDHVYDGKKSLCTEGEITLLNYYAQTKYLADQASQLIPAVTLRTNFFGKTPSNKLSFSDWILDKLSKGAEFQGFDDVYFSPLHVETLCQHISKVLKSFAPGIYNLGSRRGFSKYEFIVKLAEHYDYSAESVSPVKYAAAGLSVPRPLNMRMDVSKYENQYKVILPDLAEEIKKC